MCPEESKLVRDAIKTVECVLVRKRLTQHIRFELGCVYEKLEQALNWGDDEKSSGGTDD